MNISHSFPDDAACTVEDAVESGENAFDDGEFTLTEDSRNPYGVKDDRIAEIRRRLVNPDRTPPLTAINVGDAGDLDGSTATAVLRHKFGGAEIKSVVDDECDDLTTTLLEAEAESGELIALPASYRGYYPNPEDVLEEVIDVLEEYGKTDIPIYYTDLGVNEDNLSKMVEQFSRENPVYVRDHHTYKKDAVEAADEYVWSDEHCASEIVLYADYPDAPDYLREFVIGPARVRDLWLDDHDSFKDYAIFSDAQFQLGDAVTDRLITAFGKDIINVGELGEELEKRHQVKQAKIEYATKSASYHTVDCDVHPDGQATIGVVVGDTYASEVGRRVNSTEYGDTTADITAIVKSGGDVSLRSTSDFPVCFAVADQLGGGGHAEAAGCTTNAPDEAPADIRAKVTVADITRALQSLNQDDLPEEYSEN